ncbi:hypothetical protein FRB91_009052 [Serendipita sp. 411]|nr:hypothetical protein FRB91_009052 [Serendipita sp. 411]
MSRSGIKLVVSTSAQLDAREGLILTELLWQLHPYLELFRPDISATGAPPYQLPPNVLAFLCGSLSKPTRTILSSAVNEYWKVKSREIWGIYDPSRNASHLLRLFLDHGPVNQIGFISIHPPTRVCRDPACRDGRLSAAVKLSQPETYRATLFTREYGALPVFATSLYCWKCKTRYYHDYFVHDKAESRTYYAEEIPNFIEASKHYYMETALCELFANMMMMAWTSATNCARIYNLGIDAFAGQSRPQSDRATNLLMDGTNVWDSFFIHALICDAIRRKRPLSLPHSDTTHSSRFNDALRERNEHFSSFDRPNWNHACDDCCKRFPDGLVRSVVVDGVTIGHPCCSVHDCKNPLPTNHSRFCTEHTGQAMYCCIVGCTKLAAPDFRTCSTPAHRQMETFRYERGKAMFQLKNRLPEQRRKVAERMKKQTEGQAMGNSDNDDDDDFEMSESGAIQVVNGREVDTHGRDEELNRRGVHRQQARSCKGKSSRGNVKVRAKFGRKWTHNEEVVVASCGCIIGRITMYGSEAPNGVRVSISVHKSSHDNAVHSCFSTSSSRSQHVFRATSGMITTASYSRYFQRTTIFAKHTFLSMFSISNPSTALRIHFARNTVIQQVSRSSWLETNGFSIPLLLSRPMRGLVDSSPWFGRCG